MYSKNYECPECDGKVTRSKLNSNKYICKKCNGIFKESKVKKQLTLDDIDFEDEN